MAKENVAIPIIFSRPFIITGAIIVSWLLSKIPAIYPVNTPTKILFDGIISKLIPHLNPDILLPVSGNFIQP